MSGTVYQIGVRQRDGREGFHQVSESRLVSLLQENGIEFGLARLRAGEALQLWAGGPTVWIHSTERRVSA